MAIDPSMRSARRLEPLAVVRGRVEQAPKHERFTEHRCCLGQRKRRGLMEDPLRLGQCGVQAVPQFVSHCQDVPALGREVQHHIGVNAGHRVGAECATTLVRPRRRVDPVLGKEAARQIACIRRERRIRVEHQVTGLRKREVHLLREDRRRAVVVREAVHIQQDGLQPVPPLRDVVAPPHRLDQRHHRLIGRLVGEVPASQPMGVGAEPVLDGFVEHERVVDEPAGAKPGLKRSRYGLRSIPADLSVRREQPTEGHIEGELLLVEPHA